MAINERRDLLKKALALGAVSSVGMSLSSCASATGTKAMPNLASADPQFDINTAWSKADEIVNNIKLPVIPKVRLNIVDFGAKRGQSFDSLPALKLAIKELARLGGGTIVIPKGIWQLDGPIHYVSNMEIHLEEGAHVKFGAGGENYLPLVKTRWEGTECYNYSPFIYALACHNIALTGKGKIDGQGFDNFLPWRKKQKKDQRNLRDMGRDGVPVEDRIFGPGHYLRPQFVQFFNCKNVLVDGVTLVDSPFWCVHPVYCDQVIVRNITIDSDHINSDGVDPDSSSNVLIQNCVFSVDDDGVAIKAGRDQDGWRVGKKSYNIVVRDCEYVGAKGGGMAIGSEMSGGVSDVYVENYKIPKCRHMLYFKANNDRGGKIERVYIRNCRSDYAESVIIFTNDYHSYRGGNAPTTFQDILLEDVKCKDSEVGLHIFGNASAPVNNVVLRDIEIGNSVVPAQIKHVNNLHMSNIKINGKKFTEEMARAQPLKADPKM
ncbi:glycoside hydrolase family 28 protein [Catenovulum agarivorans]|uniref:glycoside hydrolase family 28 protein n=1 Tax=Catenovulum agarivorans TaxID=1172192 RepID=UPI0009E53A63|nr:glycoside hydrolase family 28 protein [Catenovulum agarivorans]